MTKMGDNVSSYNFKIKSNIQTINIASSRQRMSVPEIIKCVTAVSVGRRFAIYTEFKP